MAPFRSGFGSVVSHHQAKIPQRLCGDENHVPATDKVGAFHVFDIGGNKLRLIASVEYQVQHVYIKHLLDHRDYEKDKWKEKIR